MTMSKRLAMGLGMLGASLVAGPASALDGATLYTEKACIACHGAEGRVPVMTEYPKIAGQSKDYILGQMKDIKSGARSNAHSVAMTNIMNMVSEEEMDAVAQWLSTLEY